LLALSSLSLRGRFSKWPLPAGYVLTTALLLVQLLGIRGGAILDTFGEQSRAEISMMVVASRLTSLSAGGKLPEGEGLLQRSLSGLPPVDSRGTRWTITGGVCESEADLPSGLGDAATYYCRSPDGARAWLLFALPGAAENGCLLLEGDGGIRRVSCR
jgi:hypothetical protein